MGIKTVDDTTILDPLYQKQKENLCKMRTALVSCASDTGVSTSQAMQSITTMRVYHQLVRIVKYLELMDKLEAKLYESIEYQIDTSSPDDPGTLVALMQIQTNLQKTMIESHKLLEPYLDLQEFNVVDLIPVQHDTNTSPVQVMSPEDRDKLRSSAQAVLLQLTGGEKHD